MKQHITLLLGIFFLSLVSCRTTQLADSDLEEKNFFEGTDSNVADAVGMDDVQETDTVEADDDGEAGDFANEDLEEEFTDSEEFEKEAEKDIVSSEENQEGDLEKEFAEGESEREESAATTADDDSNVQAMETGEGVSEDESSTKVYSAKLSVIQNIRYQANENKIYIEGQGALSYQSRENISENQIVIEIPNTILADHLKWPFIMKDFDTQMAFLKADQKENNVVRVVIQMRESAGFPSITVAESGALVIAAPAVDSVADIGSDVVSTDSSLQQTSTDVPIDTDSFKPILPAKSLEEFFLETPKFKGQPISVHLRDVDIREVLYFISEGTGLNMVISEGVTGTISVKLRQVPWDQVLLTVLKAKKLGYLREGNVIRIMTLASLRQHQIEIQEMIASQKILDPLQVKVIPVVYAEADQLEKQVGVFLTEKRGKTVVDKYTNSIIITDTERVIRKVEHLIKNLDRSPTQVMIEAKIVEARKSFVRNLGIGWLFTGEPLNINPGNNSRLALNITGGIDSFPTLRSITGGGRTVKTRNLAISFAPIGRLEAVLDLSEANGTAHVISSPRIMVLNGEEATITQSTETIDIATQAAGVTGQTVGTSAQRSPVVLQLKVQPKITALGSVFMQIEMKRDFPGPIVDQGTKARPVNTRSASTKVLVDNGQTIVIGGIYQKDETRFDEGLPVLKNIPILKWLFNTFNSDTSRNELLLFLTPRVMRLNSKPSQAVSQAASH